MNYEEGRIEYFKDKQGYKRKYIQIICPNCKIEHWNRLSCVLYNKKKGIFTGYCYKCNQKLSKGNRSGDKNPFWKNGIYRDISGYIFIWISSNDPFYSMHVQGKNYILEHRLIMAHYLNRCLEPWEIIHHKNGIKDDNRLENLELLSRKSHLPSMGQQRYIKKLEEEIKILEKENKKLRNKKRNVT